MESLLEQPEKAEKLGEEFGKSQAKLHLIPIPSNMSHESYFWLSPMTETEETLIQNIKKYKNIKQSIST